MTKEQALRLQINGLKAKIRWLQEGLQYADHGAWGQDRERIRLAREELKDKERELSLIHELDSEGPSA